MTLHQLKIMTAVAKHRSVTKASEELQISQPSVSQQIRLLEHEYGIKFYEKNGNGVRLTQEGQKFIASAEQVLKQVDNLEKDCKGILNNPNGGSLTIGGCFLTSVSDLPPVLKTFKKTHPDVQLYLETEASALIEQLVLKSKIDAALIIHPSYYYPSVVYEPYGEEKLVAVISANHPLAGRKKWSMRDLAGAPVIIKRGKAGPSINEKFVQELTGKGLTTTVAMHCETPEGTKAAVKAGMGLAILFQKHVEPDIKRGELKVIKIPGFNRTVRTYLIYKEQTLSPNARDFLTLLRQHSRKINGDNAPLGAPLMAVL